MPERVADLVLVDLRARRELTGEDLLAQVVGRRVLEARVARGRAGAPRHGWEAVVTHSYTTLAVGEVGRPWHVSTHPSSTSSGMSALFTRILASPTSSRAMHVAQLPDSHENGARSPARRAVSRNVSPAWYLTSGRARRGRS